MKIQILNNIAQQGLDVLQKNDFILSENYSDVSGIVLRSHNLTKLELHSDLLAIARAGAGTNNIDINKCSKNGVVVFNTPGANANAVKEMVLCSLILSKRDLVSGNKNLDSIDIESKNKIKNIYNGGRYDQLISDLGSKKKVPAVGAAINLK